MRRIGTWPAGVALPLLALAGLALAGESGAAGVKGDKPGCGQHGTTIDFFDSPKEAAAQAKKEGKLVLVLHVSGNFEDPRFT